MSGKGDSFPFWPAVILFVALMYGVLNHEARLDRLEAAHTVAE